jgi:hypothetical protein
MIKHRFSLGLLALFATMLAQVGPLPAAAQGISQKVAVCDPGYTSRCIKPDTNGAVPVTGSLTPSGTQDTNLKQVNGATVNVGPGAAGTGTQRVTTSTDSTIGTVTTLTGITNALPAGGNILGKVGVDQTTPGVTNGVDVAPSNAAGVGIAPAGTTAAASSLVLCSAACNVYDWHVTLTSVAGYVIAVNATSAPSNGAITGVLACIYVPVAPATTSLSSAGLPPIRATTGYTLLFSTTGCHTLTLSATAEIFGRVQQ